MNTHFRCLESRIDKNNTLYGRFSLSSMLSGQGNTFANSLRRSLFSDLSGLAITHFCITSKPGLGYEFSTLPGLTESLLDFSLNLKKVVLTGRVINHELQDVATSQLNNSTNLDLFKSLPSCAFEAKNISLPQSTILPFNPTKKVFGSVATTNYRTISTSYDTITSTNFAQPQLEVVCSTTLVPQVKVRRLARFVKVAGKRLVRSTAKKSLNDIYLNKVNSSLSLSQSLNNTNFIKHSKDKLKHQNIKFKSKQPRTRFSYFAQTCVKANNFLTKQKILTSLPIAPIGFLKAKGPTILRASDLILPPGIRCVHPNQYLGTLAADGVLSLKFLIAAGKGFIVQDEMLYNSLSRAKLLPSSTTDYSLGYNDNVLATLGTKKAKFLEQLRSGTNVKMQSIVSFAVGTKTTSSRPEQKNSATQLFPNVGRYFPDGRSEALKTKTSYLNLLCFATEGKVGTLSYLGSARRSTVSFATSFARSRLSYLNLRSVGTLSYLGSARRSIVSFAVGTKSFARSRSTEGRSSNRTQLPLAKLETSKINIQQRNFYRKTKNPKNLSEYAPLLNCYLFCLLRGIKKPYSMFFVGGTKLKNFQNLDSFSVKNMLAKKKLPSKKNSFYQKIPLDLYTSGAAGKSQLLPMATRALADFFTKNLSIVSISDLILIVQSYTKINSTQSTTAVVPRASLDHKSEAGPLKVETKDFLTPLTGQTQPNSSDLTQKNSTKLTNAALIIFDDAKHNKKNLNQRFTLPEFFNDKLGKEKLLTIAYKAQSNKSSPFLFATISHKKVKNRNLLIKNRNKATSANKNKPSSLPFLRPTTTTSEARREVLCSNRKAYYASTRPQVEALSETRSKARSQPVEVLPSVSTLFHKPSKVSAARALPTTLLRAKPFVPTSKLKVPTTKRLPTAAQLDQRYNSRSHKKQDFLFPATNIVNVNNNQVFRKLSKKQLIWGAEENFYPVLPLDVTFTPVSKVNFQINVNRNSEKNEETIVFEIWTNGSITPKRAIQESCLALAQDFYNLFCRVNEFSSLQFWWKRESVESKVTTGAGVASNAYYIAKKQTFFNNAYKNLQGKREKQQDKLIFGERLFTRLEKDAFQPLIKHNILFEYLPLCSIIGNHLPKNEKIQNNKNLNKIEDFKTTSRFSLGNKSNKLNGKFTNSFSVEINAGLENNKKTHSQVKKYSKVKFSESKNLKLKQKVHYLHAFWRLNISDLNFSLKTQLLLKKLNINNVYDLHFFILKKSWSLFLNHQQQKEIIKVYLNFGLNSPF